MGTFSPCLVRLGVILSLLLHVLYQATDVFVSFLFFAEGDVLPAALTLGLVLLPGLFVGLSEFRRMLDGESNVFKALAYAVFTPFWALIVHGYRYKSSCNKSVPILRVFIFQSF